MQDSGSLAVFKVTARDQCHYKGPSGAFVTHVTFFLKAGDFTVLRANYNEPILTEMYSILFFIT